ncbi:Alpha/Beta hydrolase protein [Cladochytrium replicatum]|nr:Alpha/Beta hydrolase protein [Cladochytrium replicatum]
MVTTATHKSVLNCVAYLLYLTASVSIRRILRRNKGSSLSDLPWLSEIAVRYLRYSVTNTLEGARKIESVTAKVANLTISEKPTHFRGDGFHGHWIGADNPEHALVLYLHGGGYSFCTSLTYVESLIELRKLVGARVFSLEYERAPESKFPGQLNEALAAMRFLVSIRRQGQALFVMGDSAGGNLVLALLQRLEDKERKQLAGAILVSPWVDMSHPATSELNAVYDLVNQEQLDAHVERYIPAGASLTDPLVSPVYADLAGLCPLFIHYGGRELFAADIERFIERARATTGLEVEVFREPLAPHITVMLPKFFPTMAQPGLSAIASFVDQKS